MKLRIQRRLLLLISCLSLLSFPLLAQPGKAKIKNGKLKMQVYQAKIKTTAGKKIKAWLYDADKDSIYLVDKSVNLYHITKIKPTLIVSASEVQSLKLRRRNSIGRSFGRGILIGIGTGFLYGSVINSNEFADGDAPITYGLIMSLFGGMVGGVVAAPLGLLHKDSFLWDGEIAVYREKKERLSAYSIKAQLPD